MMYQNVLICLEYAIHVWCLWWSYENKDRVVVRRLSPHLYSKDLDVDQIEQNSLDPARYDHGVEMKNNLSKCLETANVSGHIQYGYERDAQKNFYIVFLDEASEWDVEGHDHFYAYFKYRRLVKDCLEDIGIYSNVRILEFSREGMLEQYGEDIYPEYAPVSWSNLIAALDLDNASGAEKRVRHGQNQMNMRMRENYCMYENLLYDLTSNAVDWVVYYFNLW